MADLIKTIVTKRDETIPASVVAKTPASTPSNVLAIAMPWWQIILVRACRVYAQSIFGLLSMGMIGLDGGMLPHDFVHLLATSLYMALAPSAFTLCQNGVELLVRLDEHRPQWRG